MLMFNPSTPLVAVSVVQRKLPSERKSKKLLPKYVLMHVLTITSCMLFKLGFEPISRAHPHSYCLHSTECNNGLHVIFATWLSTL